MDKIKLIDTKHDVKIEISESGFQDRPELFEDRYLIEGTADYWIYDKYMKIKSKVKKVKDFML